MKTKLLGKGLSFSSISGLKLRRTVLILCCIFIKMIELVGTNLVHFVEELRHSQDADAGHLCRQKILRSKVINVDRVRDPIGHLTVSDRCLLWFDVQFQREIIRWTGINFSFGLSVENHLFSVCVA